MMVQFLAIKDGYPDALLFYRMGDFYELFFDDAIAAANALNIALTKRGKHLGADIPMCGVPAHSAENYLLTLIKKGFQVAVCEQTESPIDAKKRGGKSVVRREVVRLVTPGTLTEESLLDPGKNNFLAAFQTVRDQGAFAWVDLSTGEFTVIDCAIDALPSLLARIAPREVLIIDNSGAELRSLIEEYDATATLLSPHSFDSSGAERRLCEFYDVSSLDGYGQFGRAEISVMGAILDYLELTQISTMPLLNLPNLEQSRRFMQIDAATRRNLELTRNLAGESTGTLKSVIDRTVTSAGARLLYTRLSNPLIDVSVIRDRLDSIDFYLSYPECRSDVVDCLKMTPDMDRALSRLSLDRGGPRDLGVIRNALTMAGAIDGIITGCEGQENRISNMVQSFDINELLDFLNANLVDDLPIKTSAGGFIVAGVDSELDELRSLATDGKAQIALMQHEQADTTGINSLKIKYNNVLGYFVETPAGHAERMLSAPLSETFIHRQTTANAVRFTTKELSSLESRIMNAGVHALEIETGHFESLRRKVLRLFSELSKISNMLADIDLSSSFAGLALAENWCRPCVENGQAFDIDQGRHPVVEHALRQRGDQTFVSNNCILTPKKDCGPGIWLLTGPNMAGKSTFLRQNALIAILAQIGCYVPAKSAKIGVITQLFSRVGASDDLARGRSTFMVEMVETAAILNQAQPGALVILDEIGRGTATYDGLSIAWATLEHLHDTSRCRTIFATHYHELTSLSSTLPGLVNVTVRVKEWDGDVIFLHEVAHGVAEQSYGIQVARLAGLPSNVVERARNILALLEKSGRSDNSAGNDIAGELPLFSAKRDVTTSPGDNSDIENKLAAVFPDTLTPKQALDLLYDLKALVGD